MDSEEWNGRVKRYYRELDGFVEIEEWEADRFTVFFVGD